MFVSSNGLVIIETRVSRNRVIREGKVRLSGPLDPSEYAKWTRHRKFDRVAWTWWAPW